MPCQAARRRRRIRLGLNPEHSGHNVCQVHVDGSASAAPSSEKPEEEDAAQAGGEVDSASATGVDSGRDRTAIGSSSGKREGRRKARRARRRRREK